MSGEVKLADRMIRDPLKAPVSLSSTGETPFDLLLKAAFPGKREEWKNNVLLATPADYPKGVIDAKVSASCEFCEKPVWISPSSANILPDVNVVCMECFVKVLVAVEEAE